MKLISLVLSSILVQICTAAFAQTPTGLDLNTYSCSEFLKDSARPRDSGKLVKSVMTIAWVTGYFAARNANKSGSNTKAFQSAAAALGEACRKNPETPALRIVTDPANKNR